MLSRLPNPLRTVLAPIAGGIRNLSFVALAFLTSCPSAPPPDAIRIGVVAWPGAQSLYLASELGYFEERGVAVELVEIDSTVDARRQFENGALDGVTGTQIDLLHVRDGGSRTPRAVFVTDVSKGGHVVLATNEVSALADLVGKRVAVEPDSAGLYLFTQLFAANGLDLEQVQLSRMSAASMGRALRTGQVDAACVSPPLATKLQRDKALHTVGTSRDIEDPILDLIMFDADFLDSHIDDIARILGAYERARLWSLKEKSRSLQMVSKRLGLASNEFARIVQDELALFTLESQPELMKAGGLLERVLRSTYEQLVSRHEVSADRRTVPTWHRVPMKRALKMSPPQ